MAISRWKLARIKASIGKLPKSFLEEDQSMINAKLEIERELEGDDSNVLVESLEVKEPSLLAIIKAFIWLR